MNIVSVTDPWPPTSMKTKLFVRAGIYSHNKKILTITHVYLGGFVPFLEVGERRHQFDGGITARGSNVECSRVSPHMHSKMNGSRCILSYIRSQSSVVKIIQTSTLQIARQISRCINTAVLEIKPIVLAYFSVPLLVQFQGRLDQNNNYSISC